MMTIVLMNHRVFTTAASLAINGADVEVFLLCSPIPTVFFEVLIRFRARARARERALFRQIESFIDQFERRCELAADRFQTDEKLAELVSSDICITCYLQELQSDELGLVPRRIRCLQVSGDEIGTFSVPHGENPIGPWL